MVVPAAIFLAFNLGGENARGWGIPMATDIAFALGALAILGRGAPTTLVTFLLALAVVDDIGAIVVIAVFYTEQINLEAAAIAVGLVAAVYGAQKAGIRAIPAYIVIGAVLWLAVLESGVHATIAGVVLGAATPWRPRFDIRDFEERALVLIHRIERHSEAHDPEAERALGELESLIADTESPLERLEHIIHPWSGYVVLPLFALANAGIPLDADAMRDAVSSSATHGVLFGLWIGKPVGIVLAAWLAVRAGVATLPLGVSWLQIAGAGVLAGIGFSVSIFITDLAFDGAVAEQAKAGILAATVLAVVLAFPLLRLGRARSPLTTAGVHSTVEGVAE
jgi:NhaA family Na+:H+ antiporter